MSALGMYFLHVKLNHERQLAITAIRIAVESGFHSFYQLRSGWRRPNSVIVADRALLEPADYYRFPLIRFGSPVTGSRCPRAFRM